MNLLLENLKNTIEVKKLLNSDNNLYSNNPLSFAFLVSSAFYKSPKNIAIITSSLYSAQTLYEHISGIIGEENCLLYPVDEIFHQTNISYSKEMLAQRLFVMDKCLSNEKKVLIMGVDGAKRFLPNPSIYQKYTLHLKKDEHYNFNDLTSILINMGFLRTNKIDQTLQFALRGDILDIFPVNSNNPVRIEFFDDQIESIRYFSIESQTSFQEINDIKIFPASDLILDEINLSTLNNKLTEDLKHLPSEYKDSLKNTITNIINKINNKDFDENLYPYFHLLEKEKYSILSYFKHDLVLYYQKEEIDSFLNFKDEEFSSLINELYSHGLSLNDKDIFNNEFDKDINIINASLINNNNSYYLDLLPLPFRANGVLNSLTLINEYQKNDYKIVICLDDNYEKYRLFLSENNIYYLERNSLTNDPLILIKEDLKEGFIFNKTVFISKKEIFNYKPNLSSYTSRYKKATIINSFEELKLNDYVVHEENGIGQYQGLVTLNANNQTSDYLKILYANNQYLYIPLEKFSRIRKYVSSEGSVPRLSRLGGKDWSNVKEKIKEKVSFLADRLISLYAEREMTPGFAFKEDDEFQKEFEDAFCYPLTRDQIKAVAEIKADMEKPHPMDRLLCGDVGFGKTEVAFRAAFKAILSNKQVALLCPTTILAKQHYDVATSRFALFGIKIALFSRFVSSKQQNEYIKEIQENKIHLIIGTHRLLSKDINIPSLGLLIVDEEQRFGVEHKERIKEISKNIDVLTLSATPIPRTLQMSLLGIRNLSQLQTPPASRMPVQTYVTSYSERLIKEVIARELSRKGQVYYLYNNVSNITSKANQIKKLLPSARVGVVHAKMDKEDIDTIMTEFYTNNIDVLVCTSIVESGLDVPNANTLIVENADRFGLAQLYQIKGRVGRSSRVAYAYLLSSQQKELSEIAQERLQAIKEFAELGSGYKIAQKDLSLRGAGDILGPQQSGFIDTVGMDMYMNILLETINEKKGIKTIHSNIKTTNIKIGGYIPTNYALDVDKIQIYQEIEDCSTLTSIELLKRKLKDIYGRIPKEVEKIILKRKIDILASNKNIDSLYEDTNIVLTLTKEISCQNGVANSLAKKLSFMQEEIYIRVIDKKFVIKIKNNKQSVHNLLYILDVVNNL